MKLYKLTTAEGTTYGKTQWGEGVTHTATRRGTKLCTAGVIHAYRDPLLAVLMDPAHGDFGPHGVLWEASGEIVVDDATKVGCKKLTTVRQIERPAVSTEQKVAFGIFCALEVCTEPGFVEWAHKWLDGSDRSPAAALAVYAAAYNAAYNNAAYAANAANAAYAAATYAARVDKQIDFATLAHKAMEIK